MSFSHTKYGKLSEDIPTLLRSSIESAISNVDHGIDPSDIDLLIVSNLDNQFANQHQIGTVAWGYLGNPRAQAFRIEAACASGGMATHVAKQMIDSGVARNALVVGVEKMTHLSTGTATSILIREAGPRKSTMELRSLPRTGSARSCIWRNMGRPKTTSPSLP